MPQLGIRLNSTKVTQGLNTLRRSIAPIQQSVLKKYMSLAMGMTLDGYQTPERGYRRTGTLRRSTYLQETAKGYTIISNAVNRRGRAYSRYVLGDAWGEGQANVHVGWWHTLKDSIDTFVEKMIADLDAEVQREADRDLG